MSRIGKQPVLVPDGVKATLEGRELVVTGKNGELRRPIAFGVSVSIEGNQLVVTRDVETRSSRALHGLTRTLVDNMVQGVHTGFSKELDLVGVGYRAAMSGKDLVLTLGYSHPIRFTPPDDVTITTPAQTRIVVTGANKEVVGQIAARLRSFRKPEPYKGKGVMYVGEVIRRKAGKSGKAGKGK